MEFIVNQSILPLGNTIRDHIENPRSGGNDEILFRDGTINMEIKDMCTIMEIDNENVEISISDSNIVMEVKDTEIIMEVCGE